MRRAALLWVALAGCSTSPDPCAGVSGTCVALTITSATVSRVDTLQVSAFGESKSSLAGKLSSLPIHVALIPPATATGQNPIEVTASSAGQLVGSGSATATVTPGKHTAVTLPLESGGPPDLSATTVSVDLNEATDSGTTADDLSTPSSCPVNQALCKVSSGASVCIDITSDPQNCGGCANACLLGQICHNAGCVENSVNCSSPGATCQASTCSSGQLSVSASGDVVVDLKNGRRLWSRAHQPTAIYDVASNFCGKLSLDGVTTGWRLPTAAEGDSTLLAPGGLQGCGQCNPAIDQAAFPGVAASELEWTTTPGPGGVFDLVDYCGGRSTYYGDPTSDNYSYHCTHDPLP